ncbi:hypothetical protein M409DRAFT_66238 [Zasmidium cellare ATCC 36951]|uniref:tripeptidyl-peptidase II n=1 Tax=Zasmidium cellare ATCC 36951 TaxID=1080233 RepID=A0A6A6CJ08_ZASCE|nr:uncharacterized protein M409DRAFT_66238 [Zasmidium cellare ATCC 36951]KAF2167214.1 hypothetical protein M409DRAFT_66238 [Zasmidium cellare ATCC 36951]
MARNFARVWLLALVGLVSGSIGPEWRAVSAADGNHIVRAAIALHQPGVEKARDLLMETSNPASEKFGQHPDSSTIDSLFAPTQRSIDSAVDWLSDIGISNVRLRKTSALLEFSATVDQLQDLLGAKYWLFEHSHTGEHSIGTTDYSIPDHLRDHVHFVTPTTDLAPVRRVPKKRLKRNAPTYGSGAVNLTDCHYSWTPQCIRQLYGIPLEHKTAPNNTLGIYGTQDDFSQSDLNAFWTQFAPFIHNGTGPTIKRINNNGKAGEETIGEMVLDMTMAFPIVYPQTVDLYFVDDTASGNYVGLGNHFLDAIDAAYCTYDGGDDPTLDPHYPDYNDLFPDGGESEGLYQGQRQCGLYQPNNVISISYGTDEWSLGQHYVQRQCNEWMKLALRGVTVLVAAGDRGVSGTTSCIARNGTGDNGAFSPLFPAVCPYVTTVGATQVDFNGQHWNEVAVNDPKHTFYSGGGFSAFNPQPPYQSQAITQYLSTHNPHYPNATYNAAGRAIPDIALLGANVTLIDQGALTVSGGTSAATPLFAAMITRINDERLLAGKKPIGFLNQILYLHPEVFTDITQGSNPGCGTAGFQAAKGWDPVSGLGSPVFPKLRDLLVGLP